MTFHLSIDTNYSEIITRLGHIIFSYIPVSMCVEINIFTCILDLIQSVDYLLTITVLTSLGGADE